MISSTSSSSSSSTTDKTTNISIDSLVGELNIDIYSELANQEKLLRDAMKRKQQQKQKHDTTIKKVKPTTVDTIDGSSSPSDSGSSSSHDHQKTSSNIIPTKATIERKAVTR